MVWTYLVLIEFSAIWYGHDMVDKELLIAKFTGPYSPFFWAMLFFGSVLPFTLAFEKFRRNIPLMFVVSLLLNVGMWLERWMIVTPTLSLAYHPFAWQVMWPSWVQWFIVLGSFGWFGLLFLVFVKIIPSVSMYEVKEMIFHRRHIANKDVAEVMHRRSSDRKPGVETPGLEGA